jgi:RNA polymerase sigma factor (TIGR02999 family)
LPASARGIIWDMNDISPILSAIEQGEVAAKSELLSSVYRELRRVAAAKIARERPGQTLQATELVHEAYLRIAANSPGIESLTSRAHFFAAAAEAMRRILVERARRKGRLRHGGTMHRVQFQPEELSAPYPDKKLLDIDDSITRLEAEFPEKAAVVKLRFFAGLSNAETAALLGLSTATTQRYWVFARAWLFTQLEEQSG